MSDRSASPDVLRLPLDRSPRHRRPSARVTARRVLRLGLAAALAAALIGAAVVGASLLAGRAGSPDAVPPKTAPASQQVVVLALARSGQVTGVSLLATGGRESQHVLVPSRLVLDVPGAGRVPLSQALAPGSAAVGAAVADALEIDVAATWVLDTAALAALVDRLGGVVVDVDVDVTSGSDAGAAVVAAAGPRQKLSGAQAAAYAQLLEGTEPEASRLARQQKVVEALLQALPTGDAARRALLARVGDAPKSAVVDATGQLRASAESRTLASILLPVDDIDAGGETVSYGIDDAAAADLVRTRLAGAARPVPPGGRVRVLVQNGTGAPGLGDTARTRLVSAGLGYVGGGNVEGFGVTRSMVLLPDGTSTSRARGGTVLKALGLDDDALRVSDTAPTVADLVVVLGEDFEAGGRARP